MEVVRKYIMSLLLCVLLIGITGCGEKKLTCTIKDEEANAKMEGSWVITYKDNKVLKATNKNVMEAEKETITLYKNFIENEFNDSLKDIKGFKIDLKQESDTKYRYEMTFDFNKLDFDELANKLGENDPNLSKDVSFEQFKKNIIDQGFTCE